MDLAFCWVSAAAMPTYQGWHIASFCEPSASYLGSIVKATQCSRHECAFAGNALASSAAKDTGEANGAPVCKVAYVSVTGVVTGAFVIRAVNSLVSVRIISCTPVQGRIIKHSEKG